VTFGSRGGGWGEGGGEKCGGEGDGLGGGDEKAWKGRCGRMGMGWGGEGRTRGGGVTGRGWVDREDAERGEVVGMDKMVERENAIRSRK
jgi:hypothetical protein